MDKVTFVIVDEIEHAIIDFCPACSNVVEFLIKQVGLLGFDTPELTFKRAKRERFRTRKTQVPKKIFDFWPVMGPFVFKNHDMSKLVLQSISTLRQIPLFGIWERMPLQAGVLDCKVVRWNKDVVLQTAYRMFHHSVDAQGNDEVTNLLLPR